MNMKDNSNTINCTITSSVSFTLNDSAVCSLYGTTLCSKPGECSGKENLACNRWKKTKISER